MRVTNNKGDIAHHRTLLALSWTITVLNFGHLVAGAAIAGTIAYAWDDYRISYTPPQEWNWWYIHSSATTVREVLVAFYCVTPLVLFLVSLAHTLLLRKGRVPSLWLSCIVAATILLSIAGWTVQMGLEGYCIWTSSRYDNTVSAFCPFVFGADGNLPGDMEWGSGILAAWSLPLFVVPLFPLYACLLFFGWRAARVGSRRIQNVTADSHNQALVAAAEPMIPRPSKQVSFKHTRASSRFTDYPVSILDGDTTLGPPSYDAGSYGSLKSTDEKSAWSVDEKRDGKF